MSDRLEVDETLPEPVKSFLRRGAKLESIRLDGFGRWTHEGLQFENPRIIALFDKSVNQTAGGTWVLEIGPYTYPIEVEDTGFFVERVEFEQSVVLLLSDGTVEDLDPATLSYSDGGRLYCRVKDGRFRARFKRTAYYAMAERIAETKGSWVFSDHGTDWPIEQI